MLQVEYDTDWCFILLFPPSFLSVARFDFSWGDTAYHQETLENLKIAIKSTKKLCAVSFSHGSHLLWLKQINVCIMYF